MLFTTLVASAVLAAPALASPSARVWARRDYVPPPPGPAGGIGLNMTPNYTYMSDFDFQSLNLGLNQELIELDLFHYALAKFSVQEFEDAGINAEDRFLIEFMADQEVGHATVINDMLELKGAKTCKYQYPFETVREWIDFSQKLTRWGESGVYGFLEHLDCRACAEILLQSITTEARQQMVFRQFEGLFPMPFWHTAGIPQAFAWTLLSPYLVECPAENPRIEFPIFPTLNILNNPNATALVNTTVPGEATTPAITHNRTTPLSAPGRVIDLSWELPGKNVSYNNSYTTSIMATGPAKFAAWISQLNVTYTPLVNVSGTTAKTIQPNGTLFGGTSAPIVNGSMFVVIVDAAVPLTPFNLSYINEHVVAGPAIYQSG